MSKNSYEKRERCRRLTSGKGRRGRADRLRKQSVWKPQSVVAFRGVVKPKNCVDRARAVRGGKNQALGSVPRSEKKKVSTQGSLIQNKSKGGEIWSKKGTRTGHARPRARGGAMPLLTPKRKGRPRPGSLRRGMNCERTSVSGKQALVFNTKRCRGGGKTGGQKGERKKGEGEEGAAEKNAWRNLQRSP